MDSSKKIQISRIKVKNFKLFYNLDIEIDIKSKLFVLIGKNGCGKSTFLKIFEFLKECLNSDVNQALRKMGGYQKVTTRTHENEPIEIELSFRSYENNKKIPLITYVLKLESDGKGDGAIITEEKLSYKTNNDIIIVNKIIFKNHKGTITIKDEEGTSEKEKVVNPYALALKTFSNLKKFEEINDLFSLINQWTIYDLQNKVMQESSNSTNVELLESNGQNLANYVDYIKKYHKDKFDYVVKKTTQSLVGITNVDTSTHDGRTTLKFYDNDKEFIARDVSDGTIKLFAYLMLLHSPNHAPLICIEEPENYLYPDLLQTLARELYKYSLNANSQVFISTHDSEFLENIDIRDCYYLKKYNGTSKIIKLSNNKTLLKLAEDGSTVGWLFRDGLIESYIDE